jgi:hypothetical protein
LTSALLSKQQVLGNIKEKLAGKINNQKIEQVLSWRGVNRGSAPFSPGPGGYFLLAAPETSPTISKFGCDDIAKNRWFLEK